MLIVLREKIEYQIVLDVQLLQRIFEAIRGVRYRYKRLQSCSYIKFDGLLLLLRDLCSISSE